MFLKEAGKIAGLIDDIMKIVFSYTGKLEDNTMFLCAFYDNIYDNTMQHGGTDFEYSKNLFHKSLPCPFKYIDNQDTVVTKSKEELYEDIFGPKTLHEPAFGVDYFDECFRLIDKIKSARNPLIIEFDEAGNLRMRRKFT